jgi:hypothetical protein
VATVEALRCVRCATRVRDLSEEIRAAIRTHLPELWLRYLESDAGARDITSRGFDLHDEVVRTMLHLAAVEAAVYGPTVPPSIADRCVAAQTK